MPNWCVSMPCIFGDSEEGFPHSLVFMRSRVTSSAMAVSFAMSVLPV